MDFVWDHSVELNSSFALYPHDSKSLLAIVPNTKLTQTSVLNIIFSPFLKIWIWTFLAFIIFRLFLRKVINTQRNDRTIGQLILHTYALLLCVGDNRGIQNLSERILVWFISIIGFLECNMLIGQLFTYYSAQSNTPIINSISDLQQSSLSVQIPVVFQDLGEIFR